MDDELKKELIQFLKKNLHIEYNHDPGSYGEGEFKEVKLMLGDEEISSTFID